MRPRDHPSLRGRRYGLPPSPCGVVWFEMYIGNCYQCLEEEVVEPLRCLSKDVHLFETSDDVMQKCMIKHLAVEIGIQSNHR